MGSELWKELRNSTRYVGMLLTLVERIPYQNMVFVGTGMICFAFRISSVSDPYSESFCSELSGVLLLGQRYLMLLYKEQSTHFPFFIHSLSITVLQFIQGMQLIYVQVISFGRDAHTRKSVFIFCS